MIRFLSKTEVLAACCIGNSALYRSIKDGLFPPGVQLAQGGRVGWPDYEIDQVLRARVAGKSNQDLRRLVSSQLDARQRAVATVEVAMVSSGVIGQANLRNDA